MTCIIQVEGYVHLIKYFYPHLQKKGGGAASNATKLKFDRFLFACLKSAKILPYKFIYSFSIVLWPVHTCAVYCAMHNLILCMITRQCGACIFLSSFKNSCSFSSKNKALVLWFKSIAVLAMSPEIFTSILINSSEIKLFCMQYFCHPLFHDGNSIEL